MSVTETLKALAIVGSAVTITVPSKFSMKNAPATRRGIADCCEKNFTGQYALAKSSAVS